MLHFNTKLPGMLAVVSLPAWIHAGIHTGMHGRTISMKSRGIQF
jgi:hypothetical protein